MCSDDGVYKMTLQHACMVGIFASYCTCTKNRSSWHLKTLRVALTNSNRHILKVHFWIPS